MASGDLGPADFNWIIPPGQVVIFNTTASIINGQVVTGGVVNVNNLHVGDQAVLKIEGPNPFVLTAWGTVTIDGTIDLNGTNSAGVNTLNTTFVPEPGAPGQAGGGGGGVGSPLTTTSSPRGGNGFGAYQNTSGGGGGGETGWSHSSAINTRRGAGGGGGRLGADVPHSSGISGLFEQSIIGLDAESGFANVLAHNGAISGPGAPQGGGVGRSPFVDGDPRNDFYGVAFDRTLGETVLGELKTPWAGAGGGAGGDASRVKNGETFPGSNFNLGGDEKGSGGGGGAGSAHLLALGPIVFGPDGQIRANGGTGGGGENTIFLNRVGGGSGGGSGGHVVLETASHVDLSSKLPSSREGVMAKGGQGGAGANDVGGAFLSASGMKETKPKKDACTAVQQASGICLGPVDGAGGDGSPGLIQLHVPGGSAGILLPPGLLLNDVVVPRPACSDGTCHLLPFANLPATSAFGVAARRLGESLLWRLERGGTPRTRR
jgi:hypothetical protein